RQWLGRPLGSEVAASHVCSFQKCKSRLLSNRYLADVIGRCRLPAVPGARAAAQSHDRACQRAWRECTARGCVGLVLGGGSVAKKKTANEPRPGRVAPGQLRTCPPRSGSAGPCAEQPCNSLPLLVHRSDFAPAQTVARSAHRVCPDLHQCVSASPEAECCSN